MKCVNKAAFVLAGLIIAPVDALKVQKQPLDAQEAEDVESLLPKDGEDVPLEGDDVGKWWQKFVSKEEHSVESGADDAAVAVQGSQDSNDVHDSNSASEVAHLKAQLAEKDQELSIQAERSDALAEQQSQLEKKVADLQNELAEQKEKSNSVVSQVHEHRSAYLGDMVQALTEQLKLEKQKEEKMKSERSDALTEQQSQLEKKVADLQHELAQHEEKSNSVVAQVHEQRSAYLGDMVQALTDQLKLEKQREEKMQSKLKKVQAALADDDDKPSASVSASAAVSASPKTITTKKIQHRSQPVSVSKPDRGVASAATDLSGIPELKSLETKLQEEDARINELARDDNEDEKPISTKVKKVQEVTKYVKIEPSAPTSTERRTAASKDLKVSEEADGLDSDNKNKVDVAQFDDLEASLKDEDARITELDQDDATEKLADAP